jgi:shikimate kinase
MENIALVGFMAVGKSAVGRNLARRLRRRFVDLDALIEKTEGCKIREIFARQGEEYFRGLEKQMLNEVLARRGQVIATGGGIVMDEENLRLLQEKSRLVGLTASTEALLSRIGRNSKRPLLKGGDVRARVEELLRERQGRYEQAKITIDTSGLTIDQVVDKIIFALEQAQEKPCRV